MWHVTEILPPGFWSHGHPQNEDTEEPTVQHTYNGTHEYEVCYKILKRVVCGFNLVFS